MASSFRCAKGSKSFRAGASFRAASFRAAQTPIGSIQEDKVVDGGGRPAVKRSGLPRVQSLAVPETGNKIAVRMPATLPMALKRSATMSKLVTAGGGDDDGGGGASALPSHLSFVLAKTRLGHHHKGGGGRLGGGAAGGSAGAGEGAGGAPTSVRAAIATPTAVAMKKAKSARSQSHGAHTIGIDTLSLADLVATSSAAQGEAAERARRASSVLRDHGVVPSGSIATKTGSLREDASKAQEMGLVEPVKMLVQEHFFVD